MLDLEEGPTRTVLQTGYLLGSGNAAGYVAVVVGWWGRSRLETHLALRSAVLKRSALLNKQQCIAAVRSDGPPV